VSHLQRRKLRIEADLQRVEQELAEIGRSGEEKDRQSEPLHHRHLRLCGLLCKLERALEAEEEGRGQVPLPHSSDEFVGEFRPESRYQWMRRTMAVG
jgi:hypothetical protein